MLTITIPDVDAYDEATNKFLMLKGQTINLEHSLISISKWESKWNIPFLEANDKTSEQIIDYVLMMVIGTPPDRNLLEFGLTKDSTAAITEYIAAPMTATWFTDYKKESPHQPEIITNEIIYYWMTAFSIPFECQKWHLNRLLTLIKVCNEKNKPPEKMSRQEAAIRQMKINAERQAKLKSKI